MLILACTLLTVLAGVFVLTPLFVEPKGNFEVELLAETDLDRLLNRKAIIYTNLKDLDFEYKMGRLGESDYRRLENGYKGEAAAVLEKLDHLGAEKDLDELIERDISNRKSRLFPSAKSTEPADGTSCPSCGSPKVSGKRFCADCGQKF
jgi:hypothetical protein